MVTVNRNLVQYDIGVKNLASFIAGSAVTAAGGFVEMNGTNYTFKNSVASDSTRPMGITTASATVGSEDNEIRTGGYVWQIGSVSMAAGDPVYPSDTHGKVQKTGKLDASGVAYYPGGFGTVVYATNANAAGYILTKLQGLV